jgi:hypothetical protein
MTDGKRDEAYAAGYADGYLGGRNEYRDQQVASRSSRQPDKYGDEKIPGPKTDVYDTTVIRLNPEPGDPNANPKIPPRTLVYLRMPVDPRPTVPGAADDRYVTLNLDNPNYSSIFALLMAAGANGLRLSVRLAPSDPAKPEVRNTIVDVNFAFP